MAPTNLAVLDDAAAKEAFHQTVAQQLGCSNDAVAIQIFKRLRPDTQTGEDVELYQISIHHNRPPEIIDCVQSSELVPQEVIRAVSSHITYEPANATLRYCPVLATEPEGRLAAIVDFTFNLGAGRLQTSTLRRRINQRDWIAAATELRRWVYGGGKVLPGLITRREAEVGLLLRNA